MAGLKLRRVQTNRALSVPLLPSISDHEAKRESHSIMEDPIHFENARFQGPTFVSHTNASPMPTEQPELLFQTAEGEDGPTETDGQREHHHGHGKGD